MTRYYFHLQSGKDVDRDEEGTDCADMAAARQEAMVCAREILADAIRFGKDQIPYCVIVADERGKELDMIVLSEILPTKAKH